MVPYTNWLFATIFSNSHSLKQNFLTITMEFKMSLYNWIFGIKENQKKAEQVAKQASNEVEVSVEQAASDIKEAGPYAEEVLVEVEHITEEAEPYAEEALQKAQDEFINSLNAIRELNDMARALSENAIFTHQTKPEYLDLQTVTLGASISNVPPATRESDTKSYTLDELSVLYLELKYELDSIKASGCFCEASD